MVVYILLGITIVIIVRVLRHVLAERPHLTQEEIDEFVDLKMNLASNEYTRFIGHLSGCEECQERLNTAQTNRKF